MIAYSDFPRLNSQNHRVTSPSDKAYNCIAWAAHNTNRWWQRGEYWPESVSRDEVGVSAPIKAFQSLGFEACEDRTLEVGFEKVALYGSA